MIKKWSHWILFAVMVLVGALGSYCWGQTNLIVTSINPVEGYNNAETEVTISGANFVQGAKVRLFGNPTLAGSYDTPGDASGVYVDGNYAYVADRESGLQIIDISDPQNPGFTGSYDTPDFSRGIYVLGNYAYVADSGKGLQIIDISDPQNPILAGNYDTPDDACGIYVDGNYAYVADSLSGLQIIDISDPQNLNFTGSYDTPGDALGVYILGQYAYVADGYYGLQIINISDPQNPTLAGNYDTSDYACGVYVDGDYAYVADGGFGLQIIDISDPQNPTFAGSYDTPDIAFDLYVDGNHAYVADGYYGLQIIDISDPQNPKLAGSYDTPGDARDVYAVGDYAYVADKDSGLLIIQSSYPLTGISVHDPQTISTAVPSGMLEGTYDVIVTNPDGQEGALDGGFEVKQYHAPVIEKVNDKNVLEGKPVTIKVAVGQTAILNPMVTDKNSDDTLTVTYSGWMITNEKATSNDDIGTHSVIITVTDSYGLTDSVTVIVKVAIIPVVDSIVPAEAYNTEETSITISGANFINGAEVSLWGNPQLVNNSIKNIEVRDVVVNGDYAYEAAYSEGLRIIDVSNKEQSTEIGFYDTPGYARGVYIFGDYAYVADGDEGLQIIDIKDAQNPILSGSYDTPGGAYGVYVLGDYAYVADEDFGLQIIDISDPQNPRFAGRYDTPGNAYGVYVHGEYAYVADGDEGLQVININDAQNPSFAGSYDTPGGAYGVFVVGDYAYVACGDYGLQIIDISDPQNTSFAGSYDTPDYANRVYVVGDYAYVADGGEGLQVINISDEQNPSFAGSYDTPGYAEGVYVDGNYSYVTGGGYGLQIIDVSDPQDPSPAGSFDTPDSAHGLYVDGHYAYMAAEGYGLQIIDISDPQELNFIGSYDTLDEARDVYVLGDYAYVADRNSGLQIIDISDRQNPTLAGSYDTPGKALRLYVIGNYAYVADFSSGLQVIDISDPQNPDFAGSYDTPGFAWDIYVLGNYAYVAAGDSGLQIIDISDPQNPGFIGSYDTPDYPRGVYVLGDYAYVADRESGLQVIDISDRQNPGFTGSYDTPDFSYGIYVLGDYAYVADRESGLQIIDISDPQNPKLAGSYDTPGDAWDVYAVGDYAYVADKDSGLLIIRVSFPLTNTSVLDSQTISAMIPSGVPEGTYNVMVTNPNGQKGVLSGGFEIKQHYPPEIVKVNDVCIPSYPSYPYYVHSGTSNVVIAARAGEIFTITPEATDPEENDNVSFTYSGWMTTNEKTTDYSDIGTYEVTITATDDWGLSSSVTVTIEVAVMPLINSVISDQGSNGTLITLSGEDFEAGAMVHLVGRPGLVGTCLDGRHIGSVTVDGDYAYVQTYYKDPNSNYSGPVNFPKLHIIDISDQENPFEAGSCDTPGAYPGVPISGNYAYIAAGDIVIIDITDKTNPVQVGTYTYDQSYSISSIYVSGNYIYMAGTYSLGFYVSGCDGSFIGVLDINNKTDPVLVDFISYPGYYPCYGYGYGINSICASGNYMYVAKSGKIHIFDITDKANIIEIRSYHPNGCYVSGIQIIGDSIYAICGSGYGYGFYGFYPYYGGYNAFKIIDISDRVNPVMVYSFDLCDTYTKWINAAYPIGDHLYLSLQDCVYDPDDPYSFYGTYGYGYTSECSSSIKVIDITDKGHPFETGSYNIPDQSSMMYVSGGYTYTSYADIGGLQIYEFIPRQCTNVSVGSSQTITATVPSSFPPGTYNIYVTNPDGRHSILHNAFIITTDIFLSAGLNLFGYPLEPPPGYTSYDLIGDLGTENEISKIQRYDPNTKIYETTAYSYGTSSGNEFNIVSGEGYLLYMKMNKSVSFAGSTITPTISLKKGINIILFPDIPLGYISYDLLLYLGSPEEIAGIQRFNTEKGGYETTNYCFGRPSGSKFNIVNGEAYLIHMKVDKSKDAP